MYVVTYSEISMSKSVIVGTDGTELDIDSMSHTYTYSSGALSTDTVQSISSNGLVSKWTQTYTWTNGALTGVSQWVKQ